MLSIEELLHDIETRIETVEEKMKAGAEVILQCRKQMIVLKAKLKEYKHLKQQTINQYNSAADGNL